mgnify:CR=1 FL=1
MNTRFTLAAGFILGLVVVAFVFWSQLEKRYIFFPTSVIEQTPAEVGVEYEEVFFATGDGVQLHGWFVPGGGDVTWLWFHGNGGNISHRVDELAIFRYRLGVNQFIFDYRGYGRSPGTPSEKGTYQDSRAALDYLLSRSDVPPDKIVYFGRSLGAAVAVEAPRRRTRSSAVARLAAGRRPDNLAHEQRRDGDDKFERRHYSEMPFLDAASRLDP